MRAPIAGILALAAVLGVPAAWATESVTIQTLSNRADLVSAGNVLVEIGLPAPSAPETLAVELDGVDISASFAVRPNGRVMGLVEGLSDGPNTLVARAGGAGAAELVITNHPIGGPVFSGAQIQPWLCTTERNGLGAPLDAQCNAPVQRRWRYRNTAGEYADYDPAHPATDVAETTNDRGVTVPYIFLVETGTMDRGIYRFAILYDPARPFTPWEPQAGWNGSLYYKFGASCGTTYSQADPIENVEDNRPLSKGYAVATSSLSVLGTNCNTVTSAEALMMLKEHFIEQFGPIRHTRGKGGSGGSIGQNVVATGYPGLLQGLNVDMQFEDFWTTLVEVADCHLLLNYFTAKSPHLWPDVQQWGQVSGHINFSSCIVWEVSFAALLDPAHGCGAGAGLDYDAIANPAGCRATVQDMQVGVFGRRPPELWGDAEKAAGRGFANWPYDNVGRLYGLTALRAGQITPEQFVDLNEKIGSYDIDGQYAPGRRAADPGSVETAYRAGLVASGQTLKQVPIIDVRAVIGNPEIHTNFHSYAMRERLVRAQDHHDNQSIWLLLEVPNLPSVAGTESFNAMGAWLRGIDGDASSDPVEEKIRRHRPEGAQDSCIINEHKDNDMSRCALFTYYADPLIASGGPRSNDVLKCALSPLPVIWPADGSYGAAPFTPTVGPLPGQWDRLRALFPEGVCDFSQPGIGQVPVEPWTTFADGPGGRSLGEIPSSTPVRAVSKDQSRYGGALAPVLVLAALLGLRTREPLIKSHDHAARVNFARGASRGSRRSGDYGGWRATRHAQNWTRPRVPSPIASHTSILEGTAWPWDLIRGSPRRGRARPVPGK